MLLGLIFTLALSQLSYAEGSLLTSCEAPDFQWVGHQRVSQVRPIFKQCKTLQKQERIAIRSVKIGDNHYFLLVDPKSFETQLEPKACLQCSPLEPSTQATGEETYPFLAELRSASKLRGPSQDIQSKGVAHAELSVKGYFLTIDLCPSKAKEIDTELFESLVRLNQMSSTRNQPIPVGISISGFWLRRHLGSLHWLMDLERTKKIKITWINHTLTHPFHPGLPAEHNFLLEKGVQMDREVLKMERLMIENGLIPSVYFRFPGLIADHELMEKINSYYLIPIGSDAWLAKKESPKPGSIILIHGNKNEPAGVRAFLRWLANSKPVNFLPLRKLFDGKE